MPGSRTSIHPIIDSLSSPQALRHMKCVKCLDSVVFFGRSNPSIGGATNFQLKSPWRVVSTFLQSIGAAERSGVGGRAGDAAG